MAKLPTGHITYGTCSRCGRTNVPLVMFKREAVCFDPCENILRRNEESKGQIKESERQKEIFRRLTHP